MSRLTHTYVDSTALLHNFNYIKRCVSGAQIIAMVKANAYGCGISSIAPILDGKVYAFGVASLEEALALRALGVHSTCILFQGIFSPDELPIVAANKLQCVIHQPHQLEWLLANQLPNKIKIWIKVNTGMNRLGFAVADVYNIALTLSKCPWVETEIGILSHLACADEPTNPQNTQQIKLFQDLHLPEVNIIRSLSNSAAILAFPETHLDVVRPGIMLYGVSPFLTQTGQGLGLMPVLRFSSIISAISHYPANARVGYGGTWQTKRPSIIGIVAAGYGDGYPRHIGSNTYVWINGTLAPIVGRVSMDTLAVDLTEMPTVSIGDEVELWGQHIPVEAIAHSAGTIAYELLCQFSPRVGGYN